MDFDNFSIRNEENYLHISLFWQYVIAENIYQISVNIQQTPSKATVDFKNELYEGLFSLSNVEMVRIRKFEVPDGVVRKIADGIFIPIIDIMNYPPDFGVWLEERYSIKTTEEFLEMVVRMTITFITKEIK